MTDVHLQISERFRLASPGPLDTAPRHDTLSS